MANEQKTVRRAIKNALRAAVTADYKTRFPRLSGKRLRFLVKQKAEMLYAQGIRPTEAEKAEVEAA